MKKATTKIRPSGALTFDECGYAYYLKYVIGVRQEFVSANMPFGTAVHEAFLGYVLALATGRSGFNTVETFREHWGNSLETTPMEFSASFAEEDLTNIGLVLADQIPEFWDKTGLVPLIDAHGPVVERRFEVSIGRDVILSGEPDLVAMDCEGGVIPLDIKTSGVEYSEEFLLASDQLTDYQIITEHPSANLGVDDEGVSAVGFIELIKRKIPKTERGKGPEILPVLYGPRRSSERLAERRQKLNWMAEDIQKARFPKKPRMAYNTPCDLCELKRYCLKDDPSGLVFPEQYQSLIKSVAV